MSFLLRLPFGFPLQPTILGGSKNNDKPIYIYIYTYSGWTKSISRHLETMEKHFGTHKRSILPGRGGLCVPQKRRSPRPPFKGRVVFGHPCHRFKGTPQGAPPIEPHDEISIASSASISQARGSAMRTLRKHVELLGTSYEESLSGRTSGLRAFLARRGG